MTAMNGQQNLTGHTNCLEFSVQKNLTITLYQVFSGALHKSKTSTIIAVCGNGVTENGEVCDGDTIQCSEWNADYIGGTATCNSTCDGYNEGNCETDGW